MRQIARSIDAKRISASLSGWLRSWEGHPSAEEFSLRVN